MKRKAVFSVIIIMLCSQIATAQSVTREDAAIVATRYLSSFTEASYDVESLVGDYSSDGTLLIYRINYRNGSWCIVSGDMRFEPILAFGFSLWDEDDLPEALVMLF